MYPGSPWSGERELEGCLRMLCQRGGTQWGRSPNSFCWRDGGTALGRGLPPLSLEGWRNEPGMLRQPANNGLAKKDSYVLPFFLSLRMRIFVTSLKFSRIVTYILCSSFCNASCNGQVFKLMCSRFPPAELTFLQRWGCRGNHERPQEGVPNRHLDEREWERTNTVCCSGSWTLETHWRRTRAFHSHTENY